MERPAGVPTKFQHRAIRRPVLTGAAVALLIALVVGFGDGVGLGLVAFAATFPIYAAIGFWLRKRYGQR